LLAQKSSSLTTGTTPLNSFTDGINPSAISTVITDGISVGNYGMAGNCLATLCEIPTDNIRR